MRKQNLPTIMIHTIMSYTYHQFAKLLDELIGVQFMKLLIN